LFKQQETKVGKLTIYSYLFKGRWLSKKLPYLYLLLAVDVAFIVLHVLYGTEHILSGKVNPSFFLGREESYAETLQHGKEGFIVLLLGLLAARQRSFLYLIWALLFLYLGLDDALEIHENLGYVLSNELGFSPIFGLGTQALGELTVWAFFGFFFFTAIATTYRFSPDRLSKEQSRYLFMLLILFAIPTIALDMGHDMVHKMWPSWQLQILLTIPEDGGELFALSVIVWYVLLMREQQDKR
jgi:hypothetical protein